MHNQQIPEHFFSSQPTWLGNEGIISPFYDVYVHSFTQHFTVRFILFLAEPPKIKCQPVSQNDVVPGNTVAFTIQATGTQPLNYQWEWKPAVEVGGGEEWQPCPAGWCDGATLTIPRAHKSIEGSYRCSVSNNNGSHTSEPAELSVGKNHSCISQLLCNEKRKS